MLKKFCYILAVALTLISLSYQSAKPLFLGYAENFEVYLGDSSSVSKILTVSKSDYPFINNLKGESVEIYRNDFDVDEFFNDYNAKIIFTERVGEIVSYYGYSKDVKYKKIINERAINLHVAVDGEKVKIGSPIIFGSF